MDQSVTNQFHAALNFLLTQEGRGAQRRLASQQNIDRGYLNAIVKARKSGTDELRARIASHFNMTYEDMLALGRSIVEGDRGGEISQEEKGREQIKATQNDTVRLDREIIDLKLTGKFRETQSSISEKIMKVVEILESETSYRDVLSELIDAFHEAVSIKNDNRRLRNQLREMESRIDSLEKRMND